MTTTTKFNTTAQRRRTMPLFSFLHTIIALSLNHWYIHDVKSFSFEGHRHHHPTTKTARRLSPRYKHILHSSATPTADETSTTIESAPIVTKEEYDKMTAFEILAGNVGQCLIQSDLKRNDGGDGASTGWTSWVDDKAAFRLQNCIDLLQLNIPENPTELDTLSESSYLSNRDESLRYLKFLKNTPTPLQIELSPTLRTLVNTTIYDYDLQQIDSTRDELLKRIGCRIILLPSGSMLNQDISTPAGAMAYGKLLYGGVKRFRLLKSSSGSSFRRVRRTGERMAIMNTLSNNNKKQQNEKCWLQYGGPQRNYEAVDMGPCAVLEVIILPKGLSLDSVFEGGEDGGGGGDMCLSHLNWDPQSMLSFYEESEEDEEMEGDSEDEETNHDDDDDNMSIMSGKQQNEFLVESFTSTVGGLQPQIQSIVRRVLDGRVIRPVGGGGGGKGIDDKEEEEEGRRNERRSMLEAEELASLGLNPVRGLLLYGPPGCGKTALAREISKTLRARPPKIVSAPELLDRWVGGSEKLVRQLFADAEEELKACNNDATKSALHVVVIDEIDAVFRKRTSAEDSGEATRASAVNQILAKLDGVNAIPNVLLIGMTNRRELLDEALLRPGRLEVQVEIPLPDQRGRREILQIHFEALRQRGRLSQPLCRAIDGSYTDSTIQNQNELDEENISTTSKRAALAKKIRKAMGNLPFSTNTITDLAADSVTGGFSGADIAGLVRCAGSIALSRARQRGDGVEGLLVTLEDVVEALDEVKL